MPAMDDCPHRSPMLHLSQVGSFGLCAGSHLTALHNQHVRSCWSSSCAHAQTLCANCNNSHEASSTSCPFFIARLSPGQLQKVQEQHVQRLRWYLKAQFPSSD